jgi:hypothetical protein
MQHIYPEPQDVGIKIPPHIRADRFCKGFEHALKGGQITEVKQLRLSFREGYRAGKLYLRDLRRAMGIINFPVQGRMRFTVQH